MLPFWARLPRAFWETRRHVVHGPFACHCKAVLCLGLTFEMLQAWLHALPSRFLAV